MQATATLPTGASFLKEGRKALRSIVPQFVLNWRERRFYEKLGEVELHFVEFLCRPKQDSIDIGANDGCYIHFMKPYSRQVIAFEPLPWLAQALKHKFSDNKVTIKEIALSDHGGVATLYIPQVNGTAVTGCSTVSQDASATYPATQSLTVAMDRLDDVYSGAVGFIKIDVEGHEESAIAGARRTIAENRPRMLVELVERLCPGAIARTTAYFRNLGYAGFFIYHGELLSADRFDIAVMQNDANYPDLTGGLEDRKRFGDYVYNFIFLPQEEAELVVAQIRDRIAAL